MSNFLFRTYPKYKWVLALNDILVFHISFFITLTIRYSFNPDSFFVKQYIANDYFKGSILIYSILCIFYYQYANMYKIQNIFRNGVHIFLIIKSTFFVIMGFIIFHFLFFYIELQSRVFFGIWSVVLCILMLISRIPFVGIVSGMPAIRDKVVIIGAGIKGRRLHYVFKNKVKFKEVIGYLDDVAQDMYVEGVPVLGKVENAAEVMYKHGVDYFVLAEDNVKRDRFFKIFKHFLSNKLPLYVSSKYVRTLYERLKLDRFEDFGMVRFNSQINNKLFLYLKRVFDIVLCLFFIVLFSPVFIVISLVIFFTSKGDIIYKQIRIGKRGRPFYFYKFRSMYADSDKDVNRNKSMESFIKGDFVSEDGINKIVNKYNITPIGYYLRKYSLDELPQLFNVLKGDMSLVGPRPCIVSEWKIYDDWQKLRLDFIPGCTGVWQVCGRSTVDFEDSVLMDVYYNQNHTLWFDMKIILKTFSVILNGKGGG